MHPGVVSSPELANLRGGNLAIFKGHLVKFLEVTRVYEWLSRFVVN